MNSYTEFIECCWVIVLVFASIGASGPFRRPYFYLFVECCGFQLQLRSRHSCNSDALTLWPICNYQ